MGSPVSVTVVNLVMEEVEDTFDPPPCFWERYVDDTIIAVKSDQMSAFHIHLNSINSHIQFSMEVESGDSLPFLDGWLCGNPYLQGTNCHRKLSLI